MAVEDGMSFTAAHGSRSARYACQRCRDRKARFSYRGEVRADRDHTLCFECFRSERERQRARRLTEEPVGTASAAMPEARGRLRPELGERQAAHRRAMLAHLGRLREATTTGTAPGVTTGTVGVVAETFRRDRAPSPTS